MWKRFINMSWILFYSLAFLTIWLIPCVCSENQVGCLFSSRVCEYDEDCFDDNAFGRCQRAFGADNDKYRHNIGSDTTKLLERELARLFSGGYRWRHQYTQCVVQNILYSNRHQVSYDPGLCARIMQFTLPEVPPEVMNDIETAMPDELAYIKFKPNRADHDNDEYADEIFAPPSPHKSHFEDDKAKRGSVFSENNPRGSLFSHKDLSDGVMIPINTANNQQTLYDKLLEAAEDTKNLLENYEKRAVQRSEKKKALIQTDPVSGMPYLPAYSEGSTEWLPATDDSDALVKSYLLPISDSNPDETETHEDEENDTLTSEIFKHAKTTLPAENHQQTQPQEEDAQEQQRDSYWGENTDEGIFRWNYKHKLPPLDEDGQKWKYPYDAKESPSLYPELTDEHSKRVEDVSKWKFPYEMEEDSVRYPTIRLNEGQSKMDNDVSKYAYPSYKGEDYQLATPSTQNDVVEDDYLEDQLYAILPMEGKLPTFNRNMRYDTKKPGPGYYVHEEEGNSKEEDEIAEEGEKLLTKLMESAHRDHLQTLFNHPILEHKSVISNPSQEIVGNDTVHN